MIIDKSKIILKLLISLNQGDSGYCYERINIAETQYNELVEKGIITEETE